MGRPKHRNGEEVALSAVLPFAEFLVKNGQGSRFCWEELRQLPSVADSFVYMMKLAGSLPINLRFQAKKLVEDNIPTGILAKVA